MPMTVNPEGISPQRTSNSLMARARDRASSIQVRSSVDLSKIDKAPLTAEELYANGLRQLKVGTPYFFDNDDDEKYHKLLKKNDEIFANRMSGSTKWSHIADAANSEVSPNKLDPNNKGWGDDYRNEDEPDNDLPPEVSRSPKGHQTVPMSPGKSSPGRRSSKELSFSARRLSTNSSFTGRPGQITPQLSKAQQRDLQRAMDMALYGQDPFDTIIKNVKAAKQAKRRKPGLKGTLAFYLEKIPVKSPNSRVRQTWDAISILFSLYSVYIAMFDIAFLEDHDLPLR